jgi:hypothetical protein
VIREGEIWMPVELRVGDVNRRLELRDVMQIVTVTTATRPAEVVLDPESMLLDIDIANNRKSL